ncbi:hypothetical protein HKD37_03G007079 [Glycine soja]
MLNFCVAGTGIANLECVVLPPGNSNDAIPLEATVQTIPPLDRIADDNVFQTNVLPVPPYLYRNRPLAPQFQVKNSHHMQSQFESQMQSQGLALPPEHMVGPSGPCASTKESCVDPSRNDPGTGDSDKCRLYIEANPPRLVALGRVYEGSTIHNIPLLPGQVKVGVEEVKDAQAPVPIPTDEVTLVGQALNIFLAWLTHLVKPLLEHAAISPAKPPQRSDPEVDDSLYLMTLTIQELFLKPFQVNWDATMFGVFNPDFLLHIKHEDLPEISHGGQCLIISVIQLHLTETTMRAGNSDVYGFLEPQSIQRSGQSQFDSKSYIKSWMQSSKRDVYLGAYLNGGHWQMMVILPKENLVVWFYSLHSRLDNYLKEIINSLNPRLLLGGLLLRKCI